MEWVETTAKTIDEAKDAALDQLGIDHDEAEFVIVEEPRQGLFRQVRGVARVRARVAPRTPRAKTERRSRRPKGGGRDGGGSEEASTGETNARSGGNRGRRGGGRAGSDGKVGSQPETTDGGVGEAIDAPDSPAATSDSNNGRTKSSRSRNDRGPRSGRGSSSGRTTASDPSTEEDHAMPMTLDQQVASAEAFLTGLLGAFGLDGQVETNRVDDDNAELNIVGEDLGILIGPRGQTLNAIQELTRISLQQKAAGSWEGHVHVDVSGYRGQRRAALARFVAGIAADVLESGTAKALEPMSASDRKAVHDVVNDIDGVHTTSEGTEPRRWVKIVPD
jgi:spoIIIJ-associated protein